MAQRAANELRAVQSVSLAMALEQRLHVLGEVDRIISEVDKAVVDSNERLEKLRARQVRQASGAVILSLLLMILRSTTPRG